MGKSAQFPLHTWLADAMEGPTPVSALIHAATMVAAGVFLVARFFLLFETSPTAMNTVAVIGGFTAVFAASMGLVANDIKRVLAYSTVSQLGYMMLALGVGAYGAAIFHLFTHSFFKALLFLGAGSVSHAAGTFDMRYMGGLRRVMHWTYATFLIGSLSLAGIFPLAGFWSKEEILTLARGQGELVSQTVFWLALLAVFMTAFYMFRALFMIFEGKFRGGADTDPETESGGVHLAESPVVMVAPLVLLAVASVVAGFLANPTTSLGVVPIHWITEFLGHGPAHEEVEGFNIVLAAVSSLVAVAGIGLAFLMYFSKRVSPERLGERLKPAYLLLSRKYYFDEAYETVLVGRSLYAGLAWGLDWFDKSVVDRVANLAGWLGANTGRRVAAVADRAAPGLRRGDLRRHSVHHRTVHLLPVVRGLVFSQRCRDRRAFPPFSIFPFKGEEGLSSPPALRERVREGARGYVDVGLLRRDGVLAVGAVRILRPTHGDGVPAFGGGDSRRVARQRRPQHTPLLDGGGAGRVRVDHRSLRPVRDRKWLEPLPACRTGSRAGSHWKPSRWSTSWP